MKKEYPLHLIFIIYIFAVIYLSLYYWKKLSILEKDYKNKIIPTKSYKKKRKSLIKQFRIWGVLVVVSTFILMVIYSQLFL